MADPIKTSYDEPVATGGNREDLSDVIYDLTPTETPFITLCGAGKRATGTSHDWLTDKLNDPAENAQTEGDDAGTDTSTDRKRLANNTQILSKVAKVSGTQESGTDPAGVKSELAYQVTRRMKEIKRDLESALVGEWTGASPLQKVKALGSETVARHLAGFSAYMTAETTINADGTAVTAGGEGTAFPTPATAEAAFTEDLLKAGLEKLWIQSGGAENITALFNSYQRSVFSGFTATNTRYEAASEKRLTASIDVYDGDFHTVTANPDRYCAKGAVYLLDRDYIKLADMRSVHSQDLAVTGDSRSKQILWETTLEVNNPLAHILLAGLTTKAPTPQP